MESNRDGKRCLTDVLNILSESKTYYSLQRNGEQHNCLTDFIFGFSIFVFLNALCLSTVRVIDEVASVPLTFYLALM